MKHTGVLPEGQPRTSRKAAESQNPALSQDVPELPYDCQAGCPVAVSGGTYHDPGTAGRTRAGNGQSAAGSSFISGALVPRAPDKQPFIVTGIAKGSR